ncbi:hypothetical protein Pelo_18063 [Pelomyxa schiedti]|nr:hypothetical protein Pelo_18063 [Pelomyxa schiedti]
MWNSAITVRYFLERFYQFITVDEDRQAEHRRDITNDDRMRAMDLAKSFHCRKCGHNFQIPNPPCPETTKEEAFSFYEVKGRSTHHLSGNGSELEQALEDFVCPITGVGVTESIIGFGLTMQGESLLTDLSPLSYEAFTFDKVRKTSRGKKIVYWLPFAVNADHWEKARPLAEDILSLICSSNTSSFRPDMIYPVISSLWKEWSDKLVKRDTFSFANHYPGMVSAADEHIQGLVNNSQSWGFPPQISIMQFLLLTSVPLETVIPALSDTLMMWNSFHIARKYPYLADLCALVPSSERISRSWDACSILMKITCLKVRFVMEVARPSSEGIEAMLERYNASGGHAPVKTIQKFQDNYKKIMQCSSFFDWFSAMGLGNPTEQELCAALEKAMKVSEIMGFHKRPPRITFRTHYLFANPNHGLAVVGNLPELGNWRISNRGRMHSVNERGWWETTVAVPAETWFTWKMVVCDGEQIVRWEERLNRVSDTGREDTIFTRMWNC